MEDRGRITGWSASAARADGLAGAAVGDRVEIDGSGPAFVTGLASGHVELAPLSSAAPSIGASVRAAGPLQVPVGDSLLGRSVDALGRPAEGGVVHPLFFSAPPLRPDPKRDRLPLGLWVFDLKQRFTVGATVLAAVESPAILRHMARHHARSGRVVVTASLAFPAAVEPNEIVVQPGPDPTPAAAWLVPWTAMAVADHVRSQGRDAVVLLDSLDCWRALSEGFSGLGSWRTHLGRLLGHASSTAKGSVSLIAMASLTLAPSVEPMFDGAIDLERALEGIPVPDGGTFLKPAIKIRPPGRVGGLMALLAKRSDEPEALRAREALRFRPGIREDYVAELAAFLAACELETLKPGAVPEFLDAFVRRLPSSMLEDIRKRGEVREEDQAAILALARQVMLDTMRP